jgi:hypothetical protein
MKKKLVLITIIIMCCNCVTSKKYHKKEKENIRKTDSILNDFKLSRSIDFNENY